MDTNSLNVPEHIAFIMDGNGRWATSRGLKRSAGHYAGAETLDKVTRLCYKKGVKTVTFYAFSTENWRSPAEEVAALTNILTEYLKKMIGYFEEDSDEIYTHTRVRFIGDTKVFNLIQRNMIDKITRVSEKSEKKMEMNIAVNYGGRAEIVAAVNSFIKEHKGKKITEQDICDRIYTAGQPDPDLIVRTAGEMRLSNFLIWQAAYSEFVSVPVCWPDFEEKDLDAAIEEYSHRTRKFGGLK